MFEYPDTSPAGFSPFSPRKQEHNVSKNALSNKKRIVVSRGVGGQVGPFVLKPQEAG